METYENNNFVSCWCIITINNGSIYGKGLIIFFNKNNCSATCTYSIIKNTILIIINSTVFITALNEINTCTRRFLWTLSMN